MDIKHSIDKYREICGCEVDTDAIRESISIIIESGIDHEFRTTTVKEYHSAEDFDAMADLIKGDSKYFLQHFEDSGNLIGDNLSPLSGEEMAAYAEAIRNKVPNVALRGV
jgi:pyruvate formate lyase activating enzyme